MEAVHGGRLGASIALFPGSDRSRGSCWKTGIIPNATIHYTCSRHSEGACDRGISSMLAGTIAVEPPFFTPLPLSSERLFVAPLL
jgi:hypothetical protein